MSLKNVGILYTFVFAGVKFVIGILLLLTFCSSFVICENILSFTEDEGSIAFACA